MLIASAGTAVGTGLGLGVGDGVGAGVGDAVGLAVGESVGTGVGDAVGGEVGDAVGAGVDVRPGVLGGIVGFGGVGDGRAVAPAGDGVGEDGGWTAGTFEMVGDGDGEFAGLDDAVGGWRTESGDGPKNDGAMSWILDKRPPRNGIFVIGGSSGRAPDALTPRMASMSA